MKDLIIAKENSYFLYIEVVYQGLDCARPDSMQLKNFYLNEIE